MHRRNLHSLRFALASVSFLIAVGCGKGKGADQAGDVGTSTLQSAAVTYHGDVAKIVHDNCTICHRKTGAAPFALLTFEDVRERGKQITEVIQSRYMPPWLPAGGKHAFLGDRRLSDSDIETLVAWVDAGMAKGNPADQPNLVPWPEGWTLGEPDLVLEMEPYVRPASEVDTWRNFVLPIPISVAQFVETVDIRPTNPQAVHHAVLQVDRTDRTKKLDQQDDEPGFDGMRNGRIDLGGFSDNPTGQFIGWTPGKVASRGDGSIAWKIVPNSSLVLQLHLPASGKPERIQTRIGLYFTDKPPERTPFSVLLSAREIDIPANATEHLIEERFQLPVDVEIHSVYPHAHYYCKTMQCWAELPDGTREELFKIPEWNFDWQDEYRYKDPIDLRAGSTLVMHYLYDNSVANLRNPFNPPQRVRYGEQSTETMGDLIVQVVPKVASDWKALKAAYYEDQLRQSVERHQRRLTQNAGHLKSLNGLAEAQLLLGEVDAATISLEKLVEKQPDAAHVHAKLALAYTKQDMASRALPHYGRAAELAPSNAAFQRECAMRAHMAGEDEMAIAAYRRYLKLSPRDAQFWTNLGVLLGKNKQYGESIECLRTAIKHQPTFAMAHANLGITLRSTGNIDEAIRHLQIAVDLDPANPSTRKSLLRTKQMQSADK